MGAGKSMNLSRVDTVAFPGYAMLKKFLIGLQIIILIGGSWMVFWFSLMWAIGKFD